MSQTAYHLHTAGNGVQYLTFPLLEQFAPDLLHGVSTRVGGVSREGFASLNLGISRGDEPERVQENFRRFGAALGFDWQRLVLSQQEHTTNVRLATPELAGMGPLRPRAYQAVDGWLVQEPELPVMTQYADCTPLLFYCPSRRLAATSHAGWRGAAAGMAQATVEAMKARGCAASDIFAVIGPTAGPCCYQVGPEVAAALAPWSEAGPVCAPDPAAPDKFLADLPRANQAALLRAGLLPEHIANAGLCTVCHPELFYSHRLQGNDRGAFSAVVMLRRRCK